MICEDSLVNSENQPYDYLQDDLKLQKQEPWLLALALGLLSLLSLILFAFKRSPKSTMLLLTLLIIALPVNAGNPLRTTRGKEFHWEQKKIPFRIDPSLENHRLISKLFKRLDEYNNVPGIPKLVFNGYSLDYNNSNKDDFQEIWDINGIILKYEQGETLGLGEPRTNININDLENLHVASLGRASFSINGFGKISGCMIRINDKILSQFQEINYDRAFLNSIVHEFGHCFGAAHSSGFRRIRRVPIMNPAINLFREDLAYDDKQALLDIYNVKKTGRIRSRVFNNFNSGGSFFIFQNIERPKFNVSRQLYQDQGLKASHLIPGYYKVRMNRQFICKRNMLCSDRSEAKIFTLHPGLKHRIKIRISEQDTMPIVRTANLGQGDSCVEIIDTE